MTSKRTKRALLMSALSLLICFTMLLGTSYAWFSDTVTSTGNIIKTGTLDVTLEYKKIGDGADDWKDASTGAIFDYQNWEPGYTEVRYVKIENVGSLDFKFVLNVIPAQAAIDGEIDLAEVIDVYMMEGEVTPTREDIAAAEPVGTLASLIADGDGAAYGVLYADDDDKAGNVSEVYTLVLKMQESAGNDYQDKTVGGSFIVQLFASQLASESDDIDNTYDENAADPIFSVNGKNYESAAEALAAAQDGDKVYLSGAVDPLTVDKDIELVLDNVSVGQASTYSLRSTTAPTSAITVSSTGAEIVIVGNTTLMGGAGCDAITVDEGAKLDISGSGILTVIGGGGADSANGGSGIGGAGEIYIHDLGVLNAQGYGVAGFGIGGASTSITIENTKISYVKGGYVQPLCEIDPKYGKGEPEGGAAIGSLTDGAAIVLDNVTIDRADGGSKSAAIGSRYHTGVSISITDSKITAYGGNASAAIGGSRVAGDCTKDDAISIKIVNSEINAYGGQFGAGIGSGYDTHCHKPDVAPSLLINISGESVINAVGGKYAAGIGTGYHSGRLDGEITDEVVVNAASGEKFYKATYTKAQDIGFGVVDPKRDAYQNTDTLNYKGEEIGVPAICATTTEELQAALDQAKDDTIIYLISNTEYGVVYMGRPTKNNDTEMYCETHEYTTTSAADFAAHLAEKGYHTTPQYTTTLKNLVLIGADGATVAGLMASSGHMYGDVYDYVLDKDYDVGSAYYCTLNMENILFYDVDFTGKIDINTSDVDSVFDGITFDSCTFTTGGVESANGAAIRYYNEANNGNVKNIVVKNCKFNNCYQGMYIHHVNGITVTDCGFDTTGHNAIAIQSHDGAVDLKNVVIKGNKFNNVADRIIRFGEIGADSNITIQNNVATDSGDEDGEAMKAVSIADGITVSIKNNTWNGTVVDDVLQDK